MQPVGQNLFRIVGRLNLRYDPFTDGGPKWSDVLSKMNSTMHYLEENMNSYFQNKTFKINTKYVIRKSK